MLSKRHVHQWGPHGRPHDDKTRIWTEVRFDVSDLAELLGLAAGTRLISMTIDREHTTMTWTFEEPREALCPGPSASASSAVPVTA